MTLHFLILEITGVRYRRRYHWPHCVAQLHNGLHSLNKTSRMSLQIYKWLENIRRKLAWTADDVNIDITGDNAYLGLS